MQGTLIIDAYDSFTYNLQHYAESILDKDVPVLRLHEVEDSHLNSASTLIFSPGAGLPDDSPYLMPLIRKSVALHKNILGVCLGHQALAMAHGGTLQNLDEVHHGVSHPLNIEEGSILFNDIQEFKAGRYHSWVVNEKSLNSQWIITSRDYQGSVMSMEHSEESFFGIQFHPESVLSSQGYKLMENFFAAC